MQFANILSYSALILGIYILWTLFISGNISTKDFVPSIGRNEYHLGCYLTEQQINHYDKLTLKMDELKQNSEFKSYKSLSVISPDYFDKKGIQVAQNFERFIDEYNNYKSRTQVNVDLSKAVTNAHGQFKTCIRQLNGNFAFSESECLLDWQAYVKCTTELNILKKNLNEELSFKDQILQKIKLLINKDNVVLKPLKSPSDDYERQFRRKDKQLQESEKRIQAEVKLINERISHAEYNYGLAQNNSLHAKQLYLECSQHRIQFRLCEELSIQIRSLGHGSIQSLGAKVEKKRIALTKIQKLLNENEGRQSSTELKRLYFNNFEDYKKLLKLFVETKARMIKHCGCTEAEEIKLRSTYEASLKDEEDRKRELIQLQNKYKRKLDQLDDIKNERKKLLDQLENKMKKLSANRHQDKVDGIKLLAELQRQSANYDTNILGLRNSFSDLQQKCNKIRDRLGFRISSISGINDCLNKYHYYIKLKAKLNTQAPKSVKMNDATKSRLSRSVKDFVL